MPTEVVRVADLADVERELRRAGDILRRGGLVAFPTETVYGIAVAATLPDAVDRLYRVKRRPTGKPMTLMVADAGEVRRRCRDIPPAAERLMERYWPGPMTLVLRDAEGRMTGFRLPNHPLALGLVRAAAVPLYVPSANISDEPPAVTGSAAGGIPSSVVEVDGEKISVLREGAIPEALLLHPTRVSVLFVCTGNTDRSPLIEAALRRRLAERLGCTEAQLEARGYRVASAGTDARDDEPASERAMRAAAEWPGGPLDLSRHRARRLSEQLLGEATHVFCMERLHRDEILAFFPGRARDVRLVDPEENDVEDPHGQTALAYRRLASRLDAAAQLLAGGLT
jgi:L-threonylcarbamoyladenylate synthase